MDSSTYKQARSKQSADVFAFSQVFDQSSTQEEVYKGSTKELVERVVSQQQDALLFAYGVTNAGKTFTVEGVEENKGIIPRALDDLLKSALPVHVGFLQVYNEEVNDLQGM